MKTVTDMFEKHIGVKEYNGIVRTMIEWYYGYFAKVAWCAISMSYMMNELGLLDQLGGKHQNCYDMMIATEKACKKSGKGKFMYRDDIPKGYHIPRGAIVFSLRGAKPMTRTSQKHVTSVWKAFDWKPSGTYESLGGNQSDHIQKKTYALGSVYAIYIPDYSEEQKEPTLRRGDKGDAVVELQAAMNNLGYPDGQSKPLVLDGSFGLRTEQSVKTFQAHNGLTVDGVCGPKTWAKIRDLQKAPQKKVVALTDVYLRSQPNKQSDTKGIFRKGAVAVYSYAEDGWLYLPRWNAWITSKKEFVKIV